MKLIASLSLLIAMCGALIPAEMVSAGATTTTVFTQTKTLPVPPASNYAGTGGGDGWSVALSNTQVFNIFHHNGAMFLSCHNQTDASACYPIRRITDASSHDFATSGHSDLFLDQNTGKIYTYGTRTSDATGGVVCIDTTVAATNTDPFCGFTALTAAGDASLAPGWSMLSNPVQVGTRYYAFNFFGGSAAGGGAGARNRLLCFDLSTFSACAGTPIAVNIGAGSVNVGAPSPSISVIDTRLFIPITTSGALIACYDVSTGSDCAGSWPTVAPSGYPGQEGPPFPRLDTSGHAIGLCLPTPSAPCYDLTGASAATPAGLTTALSAGSSVPWSGPAVELGARVYIPQWGNVVACYDFSASASCTHFPKSFSGLGLLYTVNPDPQRPACLWVNSDNGGAQIQNFDAFTGGACGAGAIRVLAAQFVVPQPQCTPVSYVSLQISNPSRSSYTGGSVAFEDANGNPIAGASDRTIDASGTVDLSGLNLNTALGLPQFLITLTGLAGSVGSVTMTLTWNADYSQTCVGSRTTVTKTDVTTTTSLSGGGQSGASISVQPGTAVTDTATLAGTDAGQAGGTITYSVFSDPGCKSLVAGGTAQTITTPGSPPSSSAVTLSAPGTYLWVATYSGDAGNNASASACGSEVETVGTVGLTPHSLALDGTTAFAEVASAADLNITGSWTVEAWFKDEDPGGFNHDFRQLIDKGDRNASPEAPYFILIGNNHLLAGVRSGGVDHSIDANLATLGLDPGKWHHVAVTYRADLLVVNLWLDGTHISYLGGVPNSAGNTLPLEIGRNGPMTAKYWMGKLDDVRIYNVARMGTDISADFQNQLTGTPPANLVANWKFDEASGSTSADFAGSHTATLNGAATFSTDVHP